MLRSSFALLVGLLGDMRCAMRDWGLYPAVFDTIRRKGELQ